METKKRAKLTSPWQDLPEFIADLILQRLSLSGHSRFASVCRQWRYIQKEHRLRNASMLHFPWLIVSKDSAHLQDPIVFSPFEQKFFRNHPILNRLTCPRNNFLDSINGWLLLLDNKDDEDLGTFSLLNIVTGVEVPLPKIEKKFTDSDPELDILGKMSCSSLSSSSLAPPDLVMVVVGSKHLFVYRRGDSSWIQIPFDCAELGKIEDAVCCRDKFYCRSDSEGGILVINPILEVPTIELLKLDSEWPEGWFIESLVECNGEVILIKQIGGNEEGEIMEIQLFKAEFSRNMFVRMETLGDWMLFIDSFSSCSMQASDGGGGRNRIYCAYNSLAEFVQPNISSPKLIGWQLQRGHEVEIGKGRLDVQGPVSNECEPSLFAYRWILPG